MQKRHGHHEAPIDLAARELHDQRLIKNFPVVLARILIGLAALAYGLYRIEYWF